MIVTDARGKQYRLWFEYSTLPAQVDKAQRRVAFAVMVPVSDSRTVDQASNLATQRVRFGGLALCSPSDAFIKVKGRELALRRVLDAFAEVTSRDDADAIWVCYANRPRSGRQRVQSFTGEGRADIKAGLEPMSDRTNTYTFAAGSSIDLGKKPSPNWE